MGRQLPELDPAMAARIAATTTTRTTPDTADGEVAVEATAAQAIAPDATTPTIATTAGRQAVIDTDAGLLGGGVLDADLLGEVANRDPGSLAGDATGPSGAGLLPGFDLGGAFDASAFSNIDDRLAGGLDGGATDTGPTMGKGMIMDGALDAAVGSTPFYRDHADAGTSDGGGADAGTDGGGRPLVGNYGGKTYVLDDEGNVVEAKPGEKGGDTTTTADFGKNDADKVEGGAVKEQGNALLNWWHNLWADDDAGSSSGGTTDGGTDGGTPDGGTSAEYQTEDQAGAVKPKGWIDADDLLAAFGRATTSGIVAGSRGTDPAGSGDTTGGQPGPMGGDTTVNPGSEGTYADVMASRGAVLSGSAVDWVGQPKPVDGGVKTAVDPASLERQLGPDETVINPGTGDAQASTAYDGATDDTAAAAPEANSALATDDENDHGRDFGTSHHADHGQGPHDVHDADGDGADPIDPAG